MPTIANSNDATKNEIRALLDSMQADGSTALHRLKWTPQDPGSANRGPMIFCVQEGGFDVSVTATGTANGTAVITGLPRTINLHVGMGVTGTGVPGGTTIVSVDSSTQVTLSASVTAGTPSLTFAGTIAGGNPSIDPVINFGYNAAPGGNEIVAGEGLAIFQIEGHYVRDSDDVALMEAFIAFDINGATAQSRPIFCWYDKNNKVPLSVDLSPGTESSLYVYFQNYNGENSPSLDMRRDRVRYNAVGTAGNRLFEFESHSGYGTYSDWSANGDSIANGRYTARWATTFAGGTNQHRHVSLSMRSNNNASAKTGTLIFRADDTAGYDSVMMSLGGGSVNEALFLVDSVNMPATVPTAQFVAKEHATTPQTAPVITVRGLDNGGTTSERNKWCVQPKGHITVRESGNTTTDRSPTAGSGAVTPVFTDKPGTSAATASVTWFPMLDTSGALFWVPGFAN